MTGKLVHPDWEFQILMDESRGNLLVIEDPEVLRTCIVDLISQCNGEDGPFVLSYDSKIVNIKDRLVVITDPLNVDPTNKRVTTKVSQGIKELISSDDHYVKAVELLSRLNQFALEIEDDYRLQVCHDELDFSALHKILNIHLQVEFENEIERVMEYMNVLHDVCGVDCFVLTSMFSYFKAADLDTLTNEALSYKNNLIFVENMEPKHYPSILRKIIIDSDFCQIY